MGSAHQGSPLPVEVPPGILMCSKYIKSNDFVNKDMVALASFSETFLLTHPPLPAVYNYAFENKWWDCLPQVMFPSTMVHFPTPIEDGNGTLISREQFPLHTAQQKELLNWLDGAVTEIQTSLKFLDKCNAAKTVEMNGIWSDVGMESTVGGKIHPHDLNLKKEVCLKLNDFLCQVGALHSVAWMATTCSIGQTPKASLLGEPSGS